MFKMLLVGYLYGVKSERRLVQEIPLNIAYRWFCGIWNGSKNCWTYLWRKLLWIKGTTLMMCTAGYIYLPNGASSCILTSELQQVHRKMPSLLPCVGRYLLKMSIPYDLFRCDRCAQKIFSHQLLSCILQRTFEGQSYEIPMHDEKTENMSWRQFCCYKAF